MNKNEAGIKYLTPDNLYSQLQSFTNGMTVTRGSFELLVEQCTMHDIEWNHMDQMHRPSIHNTYEKGVRIASGKDYAISLTQWGRWPFFITVTDVYVERGLFYQSLTIAGIFFIHSIISMEEVGDSIMLKDEWFIASKRIFKFLHGILNRKLYKLNVRLQKEDEPVRQGRFQLRKKGYAFHTDVPDYYNSNVMQHNTVYPESLAGQSFSVEGITQERSIRKAGNIEYVVSKQDETYYIWPAVCPHEGGPLAQGEYSGSQVACPWHGLKFMAIELSVSRPKGARYGFEYVLNEGYIFVNRAITLDKVPNLEVECEQQCAG